MFKKGDKVIDLRYGHGVVKTDDHNDRFPIFVNFVTQDIDVSYTENGMYVEHHKMPMLYSVKDFPVTIPINTYDKFKKGDLVVVWGDQSGDQKVIRVFSNVDGDGFYWVFADGQLASDNGPKTPFVNCEAYDKRS